MRTAVVIIGLLVAGCGGGGGSSSNVEPPPASEASGILDTGFAGQGMRTLPGTVRDIAVLADGSVLVGGDGPYVAKLTSLGEFEASFISNGIDTTRRGGKPLQRVERVVPLAADRILVVEGHGNPCMGSGFFCAVQSFRDIVVRRMNVRGEPDASYGEGGLGTLPLSEGSIVVSPNGRVTSFTLRAVLAGTRPFAVASLDPSGRADADFEQRATAAIVQCAPRISPAALTMSSVAAVASGERVIVAARWQSQGTDAVCVSRIDANGDIDATFGAGGHQVFVSPGPASNAVLEVLIRADERIVVVLAMQRNATPLTGHVLLWLTPSGARDETRGQGGVDTSPAGLIVVQMHDIAIQPNGKFVVAGLVSVTGGAPTFPLDESNPRLARSNETGGVPDFGFGPVRGGFLTITTPAGAVIPEKIAFDTRGGILVGGALRPGGEGAVVRFR